ncbi:hypothetical protein [Streptomyces sp. XY533]|uniref:hypothetical protein n=1 Tax=Streptomyces sp. XY533 TaxID=1519481 RepID=UPI0006B031FC|nr:hypothetical protein [Streptomyces sp. XY533]KOU99115.1 hypothetical protein ADK92_13005 [Streptomyces sp. XY533]
MPTDSTSTVIRYVPADESAAARLGAPSHVDLSFALPGPLLALFEPRDAEEDDSHLPPIKNRHVVTCIVRILDDATYFASPSWSRYLTPTPTNRHIREYLAAHPWIETVAGMADKALRGKTGWAGYIAGGVCLYRVAHPEHPDDLWADIHRRLFHGALQAKDPAEAFRAEFFREKREQPDGPTIPRNPKLQAGATVRLLQLMVSGGRHPIGRPFYTLAEPFPTP